MESLWSSILARLPWVIWCYFWLQLTVIIYQAVAILQHFTLIHYTGLFTFFVYFYWVCLHYLFTFSRSKIVPGSFPRLTIEKSKISHNGQGISALHYNRYLGHDYQVYLRKSNESVEVYDSEISSNTGESIYVFTPFRELNQFNISEITFMINRTRFVYIFQ